MSSKIYVIMTIRLPILIAMALLGFALPPRAQAVIPAPDGGYPNFTTAEGAKALGSLTDGAGNTAAGWYSPYTVTTGSFNTGVGAATLLFVSRTKQSAISQRVAGKESSRPFRMPANSQRRPQDWKSGCENREKGDFYCEGFLDVSTKVIA
jgi:hypothetical protein